MEKYQENPQLLDPILQDIIAPLAQALQRASLDATAGRSGAGARQDLVNHLSQLLWVIASVRWPITLSLAPPTADPIAIERSLVIEGEAD